MILPSQRSVFEATLAFCAIAFFSLVVGVVGATSLKLQIGLVIAFSGLLLIVLSPARRTLCLCLWLLIQPLSVEKILFTATPIWDGLRGYEIVLNAGDLILMMLGCILLYERFFLHKKHFVWDRLNQILFALLCWGAFSYCIHGLYLQSDFIDSAPLGVLHLFRNFIFVLIVGSAIQTRADVLWILATVAFMILLQSVLVALSFATGESMNFTRLLGPALKLQEYVVGGEVVHRAAGTVGVPNQQASYHAMLTFLAVGLLAVRNAAFRSLALIAMMSSLIAVVFTFSRSAWFTMGLASVLITAVFIKRQAITSSAWLIGGVLSIVMIVALGFLAKPIIDRLTQGDDGATDSRVRMIMLATDLIKKHPIIGVGPNDYAEAGLFYYPPGEKDTEWVALGDKAIVPPLGRIELAILRIPGQKPLAIPLGVHNKYLLMFSEMGLVGLLLWLWLFITVFQKARSIRDHKDKLYRFLSVSGYAVILVISIYMMLDLFADDKTLQVLLFPITLIVAVARIAQQTKQNNSYHAH